ncbi:MAG: FG-GAP repeat domain-containing protein [Solirubrobacteraceae bacterium]
MPSRRLKRAAFATALLAAVAVAGPAYAADPTFAPYATYQTGSGSGPGPAPVSTVTADFNGDGHPDVASVNNFGQGNVILVFNRGDGTFGSPVTILGSSGIQSLAVGDVNGDGRPDLVGMTSSAVVVLLNNGNGTFRVGASYPESIGSQIEAILTDLNGDGHLDVAAMSFTGIQTLLGNGDGTFRTGPTTQVPRALALSAIAAANIDGDSHRDLYAVDGSSGTVFALRGTGTGAFTVSGQLYGSGFVPEDVQPVDLNGDGIDDVAVIGSFSFTLATALADGHGGFSTGMTPVIQSAGQGPTSLGADDFNHDGHQDLVISDIASPTTTLLMFTGNGTASPRQSGSFTAAPFSQNPAIADYNGDGRPDVALAGPGTLSVLLNRTP